MELKDKDLQEGKLIEFIYNKNYKTNSDMLNNDKYMSLMDNLIRIYNEEIEALEGFIKD
jgi:hypothetical protein